MKTTLFAALNLIAPILVNADTQNHFFKIGSETSSQCITPGSYGYFLVKPCSDGNPQWSYVEATQQLQYADNKCLSIEKLEGGYRINGAVCDGRPEQVISHVGNKFVHYGYGLCLTGENNYVGVRGMDTCNFKSPWQDFDTPSNLFLVPDSVEISFDFERSSAFNAVSPPFLNPVSVPIHPFYANIDKWFKQTQYIEAYNVAKGHIFKGSPAVTIFQTDDSVPSIYKYPDIIGAADIPVGGHADNVAGILYDCEIRDQYYLFYSGCLRGVTKTALRSQTIFDALQTSQHDWRTIDAWIGEIFPKGIVPSIYNASVANAFFVISQSDSISSQDLSVRMGDYLLDKFNILGVVSQPGSYTSINNTVSGNLYNALVVGNLEAGPNYGSQSTLDNTDGYSRPKPDIVTLGQNRAGSSSWAAPTVSVLAGGLLSVAKTDTRFALAQRVEAIAAIILAGAAKDSEVPIQLQKWNSTTQSLEPWTWSQNLPENPFDKYFGAGILNYLKTYQIFFSGPYKGVTRANGWDSQVIHAGEEKRYRLDDSKKRNFSSVLYWNRKIVATAPRLLDSQLSHLQLELQQGDGDAIALSDGKGNNRQHIFLKQLPQGSLQLVVRNRSSVDVQFGVAWRTDP